MWHFLRGNSFLEAGEEQLIVDRSLLLFSTDCPVSYNQLRWLVTALCKNSGCWLWCNVAIVCVLSACSITARFGHWRCTIFTCHWLRMRNRSTSTSLRLRWMTTKTWSVVQLAFLLILCWYAVHHHHHHHHHGACPVPELPACWLHYLWHCISANVQNHFICPNFL